MPKAASAAATQALKKPPQWLFSAFTLRHAIASTSNRWCVVFASSATVSRLTLAHACQSDDICGATTCRAVLNMRLLDDFFSQTAACNDQRRNFVAGSTRNRSQFGRLIAFGRHADKQQGTRNSRLNTEKTGFQFAAAHSCFMIF